MIEVEKRHHVPGDALAHLDAGSLRGHGDGSGCIVGIGGLTFVRGLICGFRIQVRNRSYRRSWAWWLQLNYSLSVPCPRTGEITVTKNRLVLMLLAVLALALLVGCGSDDSSSDDGSSDETPVAATECTPESLDTYKDGVLTVGTDTPGLPALLRG